MSIRTSAFAALAARPLRRRAVLLAVRAPAGQWNNMGAPGAPEAGVHAFQALYYL